MTTGWHGRFRSWTPPGCLRRWRIYRIHGFAAACGVDCRSS
jgi:hypothetical protein